MLWYVLIVFLPLFGASFAGLAALFNVQHPAYRRLATLAVSVAAAASIAAFFVDAGAPAKVYPLGVWWEAGTLRVDWALRIDALSRMMLPVVTGVSAAVHIYSLGYMADDKTPSRFFAYLSLFTFTMLMLVTADNFGQLFFGWEGVGLASYLLIGYWHAKPSACAAAIKAFVVNRVADAALILGTALVYKTFGTLDFAPVLAGVPALTQASMSLLGFQIHTLSLIGLLLFIGAMGKSAQLFLHTWLPDAMEGPTPVSALIHAATMVTAGVFLCARLSPLYAVLPEVSSFIMVIGAATALFAALTAPTQTDIKRIIAYSTCSQLGYMFMAIGAGAYAAAVFHLFTHAFFKALLFLSAGSVIHAMHHEQDIRNMGGLRKVLPVTFWLTLIGTAAITGVGIPEVFGFAGFYSKDAIIEATAVSHLPGAGFALFAGIFGAFLTAFYSWRSVWRVFFGRYRGDVHVLEHAHEAPATMALPMIALAAAAVATGAVFAGRFIGTGAEAFWAGAIALQVEHAHPDGLEWVPLIACVAGTALSALLMLYVHADGRPFTGRLLRWSLHKFYFDEIYHFLLVRPYAFLSRQAAVFDRRPLDGAFSRALPDLLFRSARAVSGAHNGAADVYCFFVFIGAAALGLPALLMSV